MFRITAETAVRSHSMKFSIPAVMNQETIRLGGCIRRKTTGR
jgi:hypothetical protein